jgi:hypothetical protein
MLPTPTKIALAGVLGRAVRPRWVTVRVETDGAVYVGRLHLPETRKLVSEMLSDERLFLNLTDVTINGDDAFRESYVAISKRHIRTVRLLGECAARAESAGRPALLAVAVGQR